MPETKHEDTYRSFKGKHPFLPNVPSHSLHHYLMSGGVFMLCQQTLPTAPIMRMECLLSFDAWDCVCLFIVQVHLNVIDGRSLLDHPPPMEPRLLIISVSCVGTPSRYLEALLSKGLFSFHVPVVWLMTGDLVFNRGLGNIYIYI